MHERVLALTADLSFVDIMVILTLILDLYSQDYIDVEVHQHFRHSCSR
jgi:hypothetical protein